MCRDWRRPRAEWDGRTLGEEAARVAVAARRDQGQAPGGGGRPWARVLAELDALAGPLAFSRAHPDLAVGGDGYFSKYRWLRRGSPRSVAYGLHSCPWSRAALCGGAVMRCGVHFVRFHVETERGLRAGGHGRRGHSFAGCSLFIRTLVQ